MVAGRQAVRRSGGGRRAGKLSPGFEPAYLQISRAESGVWGLRMGKEIWGRKP